MVLTFTSTKKSISCSVVMLSQLTSMGKNKDGQPIPLFCKLAVVTKVVHLKEATEKVRNCEERILARSGATS